MEKTDQISDTGSSVPRTVAHLIIWLTEIAQRVAPFDIVGKMLYSSIAFFCLKTCFRLDFNTFTFCVCFIWFRFVFYRLAFL